MNIKQIGLAITVAFGLGMTSRAAESVWIGGAEGSFNVAENWDPPVVPSTSSAVFTNAATVTMTSADKFCEIHALGGNVTIHQTYRTYVNGNADNETIVDVADGYKLAFIIDNNNLFYGGANLTFVKDGGGELSIPRVLGWDTQPFAAVDIRGGTLKMSGQYGGFKLADGGYVHVANGATFAQSTYDQLSAQTLVALDIDAGGIVDCGSLSFALRGLMGSGSIKNAGKFSATPTVATIRGEGLAPGSQGVFSGRFSGFLKIAAGRTWELGGAQIVCPNIGLTYAPLADADSRLAVSGPAVIRLEGTAANRTTYAVGTADGPTDGGLALKGRGSLTFHLYSSARENVVFKAKGVCGGDPVFAYYQYQTGATQTQKNGYNLIPQVADENGVLSRFLEPNRGVFPAEGSDVIVYKGGAEVLDVPADAPSVKMLHVWGGDYVSGESEAIYERRRGGVKIPAGVTLTMGEGERGFLLLNNIYATSAYGWARVIGDGTMDFGAHEGLVMANDCYESRNPSTTPYPSQLNCRLSGTQGIAFVSPATVDPTLSGSAHNGGYMRAIEIAGDNVGLSGGIYVENIVIQPLRETSLGSGAVTIASTGKNGGELNFTSNYVGGAFANALTLSGTGYPSTASAVIWGVRAAVSSYNKKVRLTGAITLAGDATIATTGENGQIILEGPVTGEGTLRLTAGKLVVKKEAIAAYEAGKIVAESGAEIDVRPPLGLMLIVR